MEVCTIIAKNYLAHARVLAQSLTAHNPGARLWTLVIDEHSRYIDPAEEAFELLTPADVGCEPFVHMAMRYTVLELSTAVKPWLLRHLLERTGGPVTYLDPDIEVFASLEPLDRAAAEHGVALTPHNDKPLPADGRRPSQIDVMIAGVYNLGYVSLAAGEEIDRLLDWWAERLRRDCRVDPVWGYFVDQRWFDLVPGFLSDVAIIREPQFNVAYWNLHSRELSHGADGYLVDGRPLAFFHYSGFDPSHPEVLSRHQDRIAVGERPVLAGLLRGYAQKLEAAGHRVSRTWPYSYNALADGTALDDAVRAQYDEYALEHDEQVPSPFTREGAQAFARWREGRPAQSREPEAERRGQPGPELPWGVNLVADFHAGLETGEAARQLLGALDYGSVPALALQSGEARPGGEWIDFVTLPVDRARFAVNLFVVDPEGVPELLANAGPALLPGRHTAALCTVTEATLPSAALLAGLDELWAPSAHVAGLLQSVVDVPVHRAVVPVAPRQPEPISRADLGLPADAFLFAVLVDHAEPLEAQNPLAAVRAFTTAFAGGGAGDAVLVLVHRNAQSDPAGHARLLDEVAGHRHVVVLEALTAERRSAIIAACDCVVSLHRETAFGMVLAEAMWRGKPVIATRYSGNLGYMSEADSLLIGFERVPAGSGDGAAAARWAEPDLEQAAQVMRQVREDPQLRARIGAAASAALRERHSTHAALKWLEERLDRIHAEWHVSSRPVGAAVRPPALGEVAQRLRQGPVPRPNAPGGAARQSLHKAVLRAMQPYTAYQGRVNTEVLRAFEEICTLIDDERASLEAERALRIAQERRLRGVAQHLEEVVEGVQMRESEAQAELGARLDELKVLLMEHTIAGIDHIKRHLTQDTDRTIYLALAELSRRHREITAQPAPPPADLALAGYELRAFSQNGEDGVVAEILRRTGAPSRTFVEFGIESGREGNCVYLADVAAWEGLFIEGDEAFFEQLARKYGAQPHVQTVNAMVTPENVEELFERANVPPEPDVVSIDVDGTDYWIWEALERFRPRLLIIEYNSSLDPRRRLVQPRDAEPWDGSGYYGASLGALAALGESKEYRLVHTERSGANAFFVRGDLVGAAFAGEEETARRGFPNYFGKGYLHPPADPERRYLDLDSGELVTAEPLERAEASSVRS